VKQARGTLRRARPSRGDTASTSSSAAARLNGPVSAQRDHAPATRSAYRQRARHTSYMLWVKRQPCLMRGVWGCCEGRVEADHAGLPRRGPQGARQHLHPAVQAPPRGIAVRAEGQKRADADQGLDATGSSSLHDA
jgi:hypothetical protein